jgi:hypothetical protein
MRATFFCLLVLLTSVDDITALSTPGTEDDVAALENNDFLKQQPTDPVEQVSDSPALLTPAPLSLPPAGCHRCRRAEQVASHPRPDPLYAFMSLQR